MCPNFRVIQTPLYQKITSNPFSIILMPNIPGSVHFSNGVEMNLKVGFVFPKKSSDFIDLMWRFGLDNVHD
jgi:hypothetical protein